MGFPSPRPLWAAVPITGAAVSEELAHTARDAKRNQEQVIEIAGFRVREQVITGRRRRIGNLFAASAALPGGEARI